MALTRPRAAQIYNLDYKQATRVVTVNNVTLAGGAPSQVDGVNLVVNDRILVTGQSALAQNGLYYVSVLGSGASGTWVRTSDSNTTGEIDAGMIVMVTEGVIYADTQWKLITDNPITIGTTALTFVQNYSANSISSGTSNVVVGSNANVTISSNGTANVLTISSTGTVTTGTVSVSGNITGSNVLTGGIVSAIGNVYGSNLIVSNIESVTGNIAGGNILTGGLISAVGNVYGSYILGNGSQLTGLPATYSNSNVVTLLAGFGSNTISTTGSITSGNITGGNILTGGTASATGNITGGNILTAGLISSTGNGIYGNVLTAGVVSAAGNIIGSYFLGNVACASGIYASRIFNGTSEANIGTSGGNANITIGGTSNVFVVATTGIYISGVASVSGNVTGGNLLTAGLISATGNIISGNILTVGQVSATGNVSGNFFVGNGAFLTGLSVGSSNSISNGATNISIPVASGNIAMSVAGQANTVVINLGSFTMYGTFATPKTLNANVAVAPSVNAVLFGPVNIGTAYNITVPDSSTLYIAGPFA